jgi:hypothetical protein
MKDQLTGKLNELFKIPNKLIPKLHYNLHELHRRIISKDGKLQISDELHRIALKLFHTDYFPIISRNIKIDENNTTIIMGGIAYNMNIPEKMKFLRLDTDDIDIKIFTTGISYLEQDKYAVTKVLSVLKFTILIICMYLKQFFNIINNFRIKNKSTKINTSSTKPNNFLSNYELILQIKLKEKEAKTYSVIDTIDITKLTYSQLYNKVMDNVNDYNMLITNKIIYKTPNISKLRTITFSDSNVVFAGLGTPAFFSQYLNTVPQALNKSLEKLINMKIPVSKIMDMKTCANNCRFMSINSLIMDNVIMMSYADLLAYEQPQEGGIVLVPAGFIYKYYKYLVKYIRLIVLRKFYSNNLDIAFLNAAKSLWQYALNDIRKKSTYMRFGLDELDPIVITYKNYLNEFHQNLFHNRSFLSTNFPILMEIADEYQRLVFFVNKSRNLFRELNESSKTKTTSIENIVIKFAQQELSKYSNSNSNSYSKSSNHSRTYSKMHSGGQSGEHSGGHSGGHSISNSISGGAIPVDIKHLKTKPIILSLDVYEAAAVDKNEEYAYSSNKSDIINKIGKLIKDEVNIYSSIPKSISKKSLRSQPSKITKTMKTMKTMKTSKTKKTTKTTKLVK